MAAFFLFFFPPGFGAYGLPAFVRQESPSIFFSVRLTIVVSFSPTCSDPNWVISMFSFSAGGVFTHSFFSWLKTRCILVLFHSFLHPSTDIQGNQVFSHSHLPTRKRFSETSFTRFFSVNDSICEPSLSGFKTMDGILPPSICPVCLALP